MVSDAELTFRQTIAMCLCERLSACVGVCMSITYTRLQNVAC